MRSVKVIISTVFITCITQAHVLIITHNYNQPGFIYWQYHSLKKFLSEDFEYVVFNDAIDSTKANEINIECEKIGIRVFRVPQENRTLPSLKLDLKRGHFWAASRHAQAIRYSMECIGFKHDGIVMLIDSDMFLIKEFSCTQFLKTYALAGLRLVRDEKICYLWAGLMLFNMNMLPDKESMNFNNGLIDRTYVDSGGYLYYYLQAHPELKIRYFEPDFRHLLDENLNNIIMPSHTKGNNFKQWATKLQCSNCKENKNSQCSHSEFILQEMGFNVAIIECIKARKFPPCVEFVLYDTFLHFQDGSNYNKKSSIFFQQKKKMCIEFLSDRLF